MSYIAYQNYMYWVLKSWKWKGWEAVYPDGHSNVSELSTTNDRWSGGINSPKNGTHPLKRIVDGYSGHSVKKVLVVSCTGFKDCWIIWEWKTGYSCVSKWPLRISRSLYNQQFMVWTYKLSKNSRPHLKMTPDWLQWPSGFYCHQNGV